MQARSIFVARLLWHQTIERYRQRIRELAQRSNVAALTADLDLGQVTLRDTGALREVILAHPPLLRKNASGVVAARKASTSALVKVSSSPLSTRASGAGFRRRGHLRWLRR